ncbi:dihydrofolate reductase family protein [Actinoplanes sp. NBRC 101535]|uniref:dihydrofolate reductase family protein n=1 Tax=Actinoplanes sp. NBRC 101535 TaxID=3032196 RepID=UPI000696F026|nr:MULTISPECIES: dihydrofolate reductase family protein [Actinoplanes]GLY02995.1 hypothetical protein Acsp01_33740 [Actinoplanes sp. NBRC 101535]
MVLHGSVSVDGRLAGFPVDRDLHEEIGARIGADAVLAGSGTMLAVAAAHGVDLSGEDAGRLPPAVDGRPLLVVADGRGRLTRLRWLRDLPRWRDVVVWCCADTPPEHTDRLRRLGAGHVVTRGARVDLAAGLGSLAVGYAVSTVRADAGGMLAARLAEDGLVDELSLIVAPHVAGAASSRAGDTARLLDQVSARRLMLADVQPLRDGHVWLRYALP